MPDQNMQESPVWHRRSPLQSIYREGAFGMEHTAHPVTLRECRGRRIVQLDAFPDGVAGLQTFLQVRFGFDALPDAGLSTSSKNALLLSVGPSRWWLIMDDDAFSDIDIAQYLGGEVAITEQGHGRCVVRVEGEQNVLHCLAKGTSIDLHPSNFRPGMSVSTALLQFSVTIHYREQAAEAGDRIAVEIYVARSMAVDFWEWLSLSAAEYGGVVAAPLSNVNGK